VVANGNTHDGRFVFALPPGTYVVSATIDRGALIAQGNSKPVTAKAGATVNVAVVLNDP
jgi:hypothetical protein